MELLDRGVETPEGADALALAGRVERKGRASGLDLAERTERGSPHRPVEGETREQDERRSVVARTRIEVARELAEALRSRSLRRCHVRRSFRHAVPLRCNVTTSRYDVKRGPTEAARRRHPRRALAAAERLVEQGGTGALSVRAVADEIGASTRAIYSTFGSKDGLLAGARRSDRSSCCATTSPSSPTRRTRRTIWSRPRSPSSDRWRSSTRRSSASRSCAAAPDVELGPEVVDAARSGFELLTERVQRLADAGLLGGRDVEEATREFNALCFGMAVTELMDPSRLRPDPESVWHAAFETLTSGFRAPAAHLAR